METPSIKLETETIPSSTPNTDALSQLPRCDSLANPIQAALASAVAFSVGAIVPVIASLAISGNLKVWAIVIASLVALGISGAIGAFLGGGNRLWAASRVFLGGGVAMAITALIGHFIGRSV